MKRAQVTIFIVIALALISIVIFFAMFRERIVPQSQTPPADQDPELFIQSCVNPNLLEIADKLARQGGTYNFINNDTPVTIFDGRPMAFLCYTGSYYLSCINQQPMLLEHVKKELHDALEEKVDDCFDQMDEELQQRGYIIDLKGEDFSVSLGPNKITLDYDRELTISRPSSSSERFDRFRSIARHPLYDLAIVAQEIGSQEAEFCNFESTGFGIIYPQFLVKKFRTSRLITIYTITHKSSDKEFNFAVRGCVIPPGY